MMTREANYHPHITSPAMLLFGAFARHSTYVEHQTFVGDLRAFVKRILGSLQPQNYGLLRTRSTPELSGAAT
jgi:hypothetical protein